MKNIIKVLIICASAFVLMSPSAHADLRTDKYCYQACGTERAPLFPSGSIACIKKYCSTRPQGPPGRHYTDPDKYYSCMYGPDSIFKYDPDTFSILLQWSMDKSLCIGHSQVTPRR